MHLKYVHVMTNIATLALWSLKFFIVEVVPVLWNCVDRRVTLACALRVLDNYTQGVCVKATNGELPSPARLFRNYICISPLGRRAHARLRWLCTTVGSEGMQLLRVTHHHTLCPMHETILYPPLSYSLLYELSRRSCF